MATRMHSHRLSSLCNEYPKLHTDLCRSFSSAPQLKGVAAYSRRSRREMPACRVSCSASHLAAKDPRVKHSRRGISRWSNSLWPGPLPRHRARGRLVAQASGGSSDVDDDEEVPGAGAQQQKQQQGKVNVHELLDDFFAYFNSTFPDTVMPLLQKDDLGSRRALLGHIVAARRKIDTIQKAGKDTLSFGDRVYVSLVANILKLVNAVLEKEIELTVELEQELGSSAKEDPDAGKQWMQEKELEAARAGAMEFQTEDELIQALSNDGSIDGEEEEGGRSAEGTGSFNQLQIWGTATAAMLFAAGVTWTADQLHLDVAAHLGVPEDPAAFLRDTCLWTLPVAAVSVPFWRYILTSETVAGEVFRNSLTDKDDALEMLGAAEIFGISALLETGAGLLFRGTILATVTMAVAGIPSMVQQEAPDLYLSSARDIAVHFPTVWMWPFVAVATGAIEASLVQASLGGFKEHTSLDYLEEEASLAMLKAMTMTEMDLFVNSPEGSQQQQQPAPLPSASTWKEGEDPPMFEIAFGDVSQEPMMASGDVPLFVKKLPLSSILNFLDTFDVTLRTSGPTLLYMPLLYIVKGTFLSAEAILTGNVWASIITATVLTTIEETAAKDYLEGLMRERERQQQQQL